MQSRNRHTDVENNCIDSKWGKMGEGIIREFGMDMYTLLYLKLITNKDLLYSTGYSYQCYVATWMGAESAYMHEKIPGEGNGSIL